MHDTDTTYTLDGTTLWQALLAIQAAQAYVPASALPVFQRTEERLLREIDLHAPRGEDVSALELQRSRAWLADEFSA